MKNIIGLIATIVIFIGLLITSYLIHSDKNTSHKPLSLNQIEDKMEDGDTFILFVKNSDKKDDKNLENLSKTYLEEYNVTSYYIDIKSLDTKELTRLLNVVAIDQTPVLTFIYKGKENVQNRITDFINAGDFKNKLEVSLINDDYIK